MHRTDAPGNIENLHTQGDETTGTPATDVSADLMNALQEELVGVVLHYLPDEGLNKDDNTQLRRSIASALTGYVPVDGTALNSALFGAQPPGFYAQRFIGAGPNYGVDAPPSGYPSGLSMGFHKGLAWPEAAGVIVYLKNSDDEMSQVFIGGMVSPFAAKIYTRAWNAAAQEWRGWYVFSGVALV